MNKADQMINRIHNLNLIISKEEKAVQLRAGCLHFIKNNYIPTDQDLRHHTALTADPGFIFPVIWARQTKLLGICKAKAPEMGVNTF